MSTRSSSEAGRPPGRPRAAIGLRAHSGWAALVVMAGSGDAVEVVERGRIEMADTHLPGSRQPYHAAEGLALAAARKLLDRCLERARTRATEALTAAITAQARASRELAGCGLLLASGRPLPSLATILASHALIHAADGEHFRRALVEAASGCRLPLVGVRERELGERAASRLGIPAGRLAERLRALGRQIGPPWREDEKRAALVAWLVLADGGDPPAAHERGTRRAAKGGAARP
jgi:hypothetical protein